MLADGSTSVLAENDLLGSTVDPDDFEAWRAQRAAGERGREDFLARTSRLSVFDSYDPENGIVRNLIDGLTNRSLLPGRGFTPIETPEDASGLRRGLDTAANVVGGFLSDATTPAGAVTMVAPGFRGGGMVGSLVRGLGRAGSGAYGARGLQTLANAETTSEGVLGGIEAALGAFGAFAPTPGVDPARRPSPGAQGRFEPWPPKPSGRPMLPPGNPPAPGGGSNMRALPAPAEAEPWGSWGRSRAIPETTGDDIIDGEVLGVTLNRGNMLDGGVAGELGAAPDARALYPAALPAQRPIRLGAPPTPLERPDLLSDQELYAAFTDAARSNRFEDLAVFEAEVGRRGPSRGVTPSAAQAPDAGVPSASARPAASIFEDPDVAAELAKLRERAGQISTRTMPTPIERRAPAPEFEPATPLSSVPRETSPLEAMPTGTGDDIVDAIFDPASAAYEKVLSKYRAGEQLSSSTRTLEDMAGVRDARATGRTAVDDLESGNVGTITPDRSAAGADVRGLRPESAPPVERGLRNAGGDSDRALGGEARRLAPEDAPHFNELLADARAAGFRGTDAELEALYLENLENAQAYADEMAALDLQDGPTAILRALVDEGGISLSSEMGGKTARLAGLTGNRGELRKLFEEMDYGTAPGGYNKRTGSVNASKLYPQGGLRGVGAIVNQLKGGKSLDNMAEALRARGIPVEGPNELLDQIEAALVAHRKTGVAPNVLKALEEGLGVRPGNRWWDPQGAAALDDALDAAPAPAARAIDDAIEPAGDVDLSFDPAEFDADSVIDELLTGEKQARLPGAGQVRASEIATPEVADVPFSLSREVADNAPKRPQSSIFDAPPRRQSQVVDGEGLIDEIAPNKASSSTPDADALIDEALEVPTFEQLPGNVRSFLTKQLGYTPDEINAMTPEQAIATGKARTPSPSRPKPQEAPAGVTRATLEGREKVRAQRGVEAEGRRVGFLNEAEEARPAREAVAEQRRLAAAGKTAPKEGPGPARFPGRTGDIRPKGEIAAARARQDAVKAEMAADRAEADRIKGMTPNERNQRAAAMAAEDRRISAQIKRLMDDPDPTPEKFDEMKRLYEQQAEKFAARQLKGGSGKEMSQDELYSFLSNNIGSLGPLAAMNPRVFRELVSRWYASPVIRSMFGGMAGAAIDDESEFRGFVYGAAAAAATPSGLRALARSARLVRQGKNPWPVDPRDSGKDISWGRLLLPFSPEGTVPELFRDVTEQLTRLQQVYDNPAFDDNARAAIMKSAKPAIAQMIRTAADEAKAAGLKRKAYYARKLADAFESKLTPGQRGVKNLGEALGMKLKGNEIERHVGGNVYRVLVGYALDTAAQNLTQPIMTMLYVSPRSLVKAYSVSRTPAAKALAKRFDAELPDVPELAEDLLDVARREAPTEVRKTSPMKLLHATDNYNRRVALLAGLQEAGALDEALSGSLDLLDPRAVRAMSIMRKTQGHFGAMGNNPLYRGPVMGTVKPFTKYPFMFVERMLDAFQDPDAKGLQYVSVLLGAALAGRTVGIDLEDLLLGGGRPLGLDLSDPEETAGKILSGDAFPAIRAAKDVAAHATGEADHSMFEDAPAMAMGRYPAKVGGVAISHLPKHGLGPAKSAGGTAPDHSGWDDILGLIGLKTQERGDKLRARDAAYEFNKFATRDRNRNLQSLREQYRDAVERGDSAKMRSLEQQMTPGQRRSLRRTSKQTPYERLREQTPRERRKEFDEKFRDRLGEK